MQAILDKHDIEHHGCINFEEFSQIFVANDEKLQRALDPTPKVRNIRAGSLKAGPPQVEPKMLDVSAENLLDDLHLAEKQYSQSF